MNPAPHPIENRKLVSVFVAIGIALFWSGGVALAADPAPLQLQKPTTATETCYTAECHSTMGDSQVVHGPVAQGKCDTCHIYDQSSKHTFSLIETGAALCTGCHTMELRDIVHKPVEEGQCLGCHSPHGSEHKMLLVADPTRGLCAECHKDDPFVEKKHQHGPVAAGACILCHEAHSSWEPKLLVESNERLCQMCHDDLIDNENPLAQHVHKPVEDNCSGCHDAHASDHPFQLIDDSPDLCYSCHKEMKEQMDHALVVHGALAEAGGCQGCHAPHASPLPKLQRGPQVDMCLSCHDKEIDTGDGRVLTNMAKFFEENTNHHKPIQEEGCSACHQPHAGERANMLVEAYPPSFYSPFKPENYALCFTCHREEMVEDEKGMGLTRFRNGDVNLHWLHVNREKGRTCRACHSVHASENPFHIRDSVPFGPKGWLLEVRYEMTDSGGRCSPGCHKPFDYDRGGGEPLLLDTVLKTVESKPPTPKPFATKPAEPSTEGVKP